MTGHVNTDALPSFRPLAFLHPTTRYHPVTVIPEQQHPPEAPPSEQATAPKKDTRQVYHIWRSRDNRKGRHRAVITGHRGPESPRLGLIGEEASQLRKTALGLSRLVTQFPVWDVSYLVAVSFVIGSIIWCINGCFIWPPSDSKSHLAAAAGILAFVGATIFEVGSLLMVVEAINAERSDCFGWALEESLKDHGLRLRPRHEGCRHHRRGRHALPKETAVAAMPPAALDDVAAPGGLEGGKDYGEVEARAEKERRWTWLPTWREFRTHYIKEIGFLGSVTQLFAATVFWISGITALPSIYNGLSGPVMNGVYWVPQVVGGTGFIVSAFLFMIEVQDKWYKPAPKMLGWHIGFWNLIGGIGFTVCPALGFGSQSSAALAYGSGLSTFIGSWAFLIGSAAQWYESLDKHPVSVDESPSWLPLGEKVAEWRNAPERLQSTGE